MTHHDDQNPADLDTAIEAVKRDQPKRDEIEAAGARVWQKLQAHSVSEAQPELIHGCEDIMKLLPAYAEGTLSRARELVVRNHLHECICCRNRAEGRSNVVNWTRTGTVRATGSWQGFALAAAAIVVAVFGFVIYSAYFAVPAGARASVESIEGIAYVVTPQGERLATVGDSLNEGDVLRTGAGAHAFVRMADGSIVEANERTDFGFKARGKNATIALDRGAVIVKAAKRHSGHLYLKTPDCRVAVTGTVFSVGAGIKGSRVSVIEGAVEVAYGGTTDLLRAGEQVSTGTNMSPVPVAEDIAWSRDLQQHLELLAEFSKLQKRLDQVQLPGPRFNSTLMGRMPADAVVYASLPNAGQAVEEANRIFQEQIQQSDSLRQWFTHGDPNAPAKLNDAVANIRQLSDFLGDEVVVVGFDGKSSGIGVVAEIGRPGLMEFLKNKFAPLSGSSGLLVTDEAGIARLPVNGKGLIALVRQDVVVFASGSDVVARINNQLNAGGGGLAGTTFGQQLTEAYSRGAGFLFAADLGRLISNHQPHSARDNSHLDHSGLQDMRYLMVEHRELSGVPENHMVLNFAGQRRGIASWIAAPAPMGSLQFVSRNASLAVAFIAKEPAMVLDDIFAMSDGNTANQNSEFAETERNLKVRFREDLAAQFGGDAVLALDGPVLPSPSWKLVIEVHDAKALAASLEKLVSGISEEAQRHGHPGIDLKTEEADGQVYYTVQSRDSKSSPMYYTFAAGYMIMGPNRAVLMNTLRTRLTGDSLAQSGQFRALLPKDQNANYSMIAYQNLGPILQPLAAQLSGDEAKLVQELAGDSRPSVICVWGRQNQIEATTNSRLLGFDWLTLTSLISGTSKHEKP